MSSPRTIRFFFETEEDVLPDTLSRISSQRFELDIQKRKEAGARWTGEGRTERRVGASRRARASSRSACSRRIGTRTESCIGVVSERERSEVIKSGSSKKREAANRQQEKRKTRREGNRTRLLSNQETVSYSRKYEKESTKTLYCHPAATTSLIRRVLAPVVRFVRSVRVKRTRSRKRPSSRSLLVLVRRVRDRLEPK